MHNPFSPNLVPPPREFSILRPEKSALKERLKSPCRILIEGPRRTGKTSLVRACVPEKELLAIDWKDLVSPREALAAMEFQVSSFLDRARPLRQKLETLKDRGFQIEANFMGGGFKFGVPPVVRRDPSDIAKIIGALLKALNEVSKKGKLVLYFDEIQDLAGTKPGLAFLGQLRGHLQLMTHLPVIFSGSVRSLLSATFYDGGSPFYRQYEALPLKPIPAPKLSAWAKRLFAKKDISLPDDGAEVLGSATRWIIGDVQRLAAYLWHVSESGETLDATKVTSHTLDYIATNRTTFETYLRRYSAAQKGVLRAIAWLETRADPPTLTGSLTRETFGFESGAVPNALRTFEKDQIAVDDPDLGLRIDDPFFAVYLREFWNKAL